MAKVPQATLFTPMHPGIRQTQKLEELIESTGFTYNWTIDRLAARKYIVTEDNMYDAIDNRIRKDWNNVKPEGLCPMCMMRYTIREACHNWLDNGRDKSLLPMLKLMHTDLFYEPASGHLIKNDSIWVQGIGYIRMDPVELPGRLHLLIGHKKADGWVAELRTAVA